jgi:hypothetical protein
VVGNGANGKCVTVFLNLLFNHFAVLFAKMLVLNEDAALAAAFVVIGICVYRVRAGCHDCVHRAGVGENATRVSIFCNLTFPDRRMNFRRRHYIHYRMTYMAVFAGVCAAYTVLAYLSQVCRPTTMCKGVDRAACGLPLSDLHRAADLSKLAYSDGLVERGQAFKGLRPVAFFDGGSEDAQVYLWQDGNTVYCAYRGTECREDMLANLDVRMTDAIAPGLCVHSGFYRQYTSVKTQVWGFLNGMGADLKTIVFCGHSLAGALATIAALDFVVNRSAAVGVRCITFGSPRVGNGAFRKLFDEKVFDNYRVFNENDPVPMIPLSLRFSHVGKGICIDDKCKFYAVGADLAWYLRPLAHFFSLDPRNLLWDHHCEIYIDRLGGQV